MIQKFVDRFMASQDKLKAIFSAKHPQEYREVVWAVVSVLANEDDYEAPDPKRIHEINDGDYQGTLIYVIGANGYQPSTYWCVSVGYGSCSGCDTLQRINGYSGEPPTPEQINDYMTLARHIVQGLRLCASYSMQEEASK
jgi:hypothetical protein